MIIFYETAMMSRWQDKMKSRCLISRAGVRCSSRTTKQCRLCQVLPWWHKRSTVGTRESHPERWQLHRLLQGRYTEVGSLRPETTGFGRQRWRWGVSERGTVLSRVEQKSTAQCCSKQGQNSCVQDRTPCRVKARFKVWNYRETAWGSLRRQPHNYKVI